VQKSSYRSPKRRKGGDDPGGRAGAGEARFLGDFSGGGLEGEGDRTSTRERKRHVLEAKVKQRQGGGGGGGVKRGKEKALKPPSSRVKKGPWFGKRGGGFRKKTVWANNGMPLEGLRKK